MAKLPLTLSPRVLSGIKLREDQVVTAIQSGASAEDVEAQYLQFHSYITRHVFDRQDDLQHFTSLLAVVRHAWANVVNLPFQYSSYPLPGIAPPPAPQEPRRGHYHYSQFVHLASSRRHLPRQRGP